MKISSREQAERALRSPAKFRLFLLYGADEAGSRSLLPVLAHALGADVDRVDLAPGQLQSDPALLAAEAASIPLFGGERYIVVDSASDDVIAAAEMLLSASVAGNPVVLLAGALRATSKLVKLATASASAIAYASYVPEGANAERLAVELARMEGLRARSEVAREIADAAGGNRAVMQQELVKLALYLGATPERPQPLDRTAIEAVGAGAGDADFSRLVDSVADGDAGSLHRELLRLSGKGIEGIPLARAVVRRLSLLARVRAEVERRGSIAQAIAAEGKSLFWGERDSVTRQLARWRPVTLARSIGRLLEAERHVKSATKVGDVAVAEELVAVCRQAGRSG